jgi:hypothetical protein
MIHKIRARRRNEEYEIPGLNGIWLYWVLFLWFVVGTLVRYHTGMPIWGYGWLYWAHEWIMRIYHNLFC